MRLYLCLLPALAPALCRAADPPAPEALPPAIVELSPAMLPAPSASPSIGPDRWRWFGVAGYTGALSWEIKGDAAWTQEADAPKELIGRVEGQAVPSVMRVPAGALMVYGLDRPGVVQLKALGIVGGRPKTLAVMSVTMTGGQPSPAPVPPVPVPPNPGPAPAPDPVVTAEHLSLVVVENTRARTPATAAVLNATDWWKGLEAKGHRYTFYDAGTADPVGQAYAKYVTGALPQLVVTDLATGKVLGGQSLPLPAATADIDALVAKYSKGK